MAAETQLRQYYPFWDKLTDQEKSTFASCSAVKDYPKGSFIHSERGGLPGYFFSALRPGPDLHPVRRGTGRLLYSA